jgi:RHS repeat-associated protein
MKMSRLFSLSRTASLALVISLLITSTPAAPRTVVDLVNEQRTELAFWYYSSGLRKLIQGRGAPNPQRPEKQADRDAKIERIEISPGNVTIDLSQRVNFVAVAYGRDGNTIGGVKIKWSAEGSSPPRHVRISPQGEFRPKFAGVFTVTAQAVGRSAQTMVTVRPGATPNLNSPVLGHREVSTRDLPAKISSSQTERTKSSQKHSQIAQTETLRAASGKRSHASKSRSAANATPLPQGGGGGWDGSNYWSADDPENRVGNPPGTADGGAGSGNFQFAAPVYSAPGRGINVSLGLSYNSRVWNKAGSQMSFDNDRGWPSPGFNLGFGKMLGIGVYTGCMIVDADGTRHSYSGNITIYNWGTYGVMHTTDGSFIDYTYWTGTNGVMLWAEARLPNGTVIYYGAYSQPGGGLFPTYIEDANGNYITISYVNNSGPRIQAVTDTLGRVINFHYNSNNLLTAVTAPGLDGATRTLVRLHYQQLSLSYSFTWPIQSVVVQNSYPWVLDAIYYPATHSGYWLTDYSTYGMLRSVVEERGMNLIPDTTPLTEMGTISEGSVTQSDNYNYPAYVGDTSGTQSSGLTDAPTYTTMKERWTPDGGSTLSEAVTGYEVNENGNPRTTTITLPNGTKSKQYSNNAPGQWYDGLVTEDRTFTTDEEHPLQKSTSEWEQGAYGSPRPTSIEKFDELNHMTKAQFLYGSVYNQVTEVWDYDYGGTSLLRKTQTTYQNAANYTSRHIFNLPLAVEIYDGSNNRVSRTDYQYDGQTLTDAPNVVMHSDASNPYAQGWESCDWECVEWGYNEWGYYDCLDYQWVCNYYNPYNPGTDYRGNVTQVTNYADSANLTGAVSETRRYDITGNLVKTSGACCEETTLSYTLNYQYAYAESKTRGSATDWHAQVTTSAIYDFNTGLNTYSTDANNRTSRSEYDPDTLRLSRSTAPSGAHTDYAYDDSGMSVSTITYLESHPTHTNVADSKIKLLNGRGQVREEKAMGANGVWDLVDTVYDNMGEVFKQTRPYGSGETQQWTTMSYDALGRTTRVTAPDGSVTESYYNERDFDPTDGYVPQRPNVASTAPGDSTLVRDAWGRERWARTDASGRLVEVVEPVFWGNGSVSAGMQTIYVYNALGNLITINSMSGATVQQQRRFRYDSLGRLTAQKLAEMNPTLNESGVYIGGNGTWSDVFTYDDRSNLTSRTDARGVKTIYSYNDDPLNRLQSVSWDTSGFGDTAYPILSAAPVSYQYRQRASAQDLKDVTQLETVTTANVSAETYSYDIEGRTYIKSLVVNGRPAFDTTYSYDSLDRVTDVLYPAEYGNGSPAPRRTVHQDYDVASRLSGLTFNGQAQASNIYYNAASQTNSLKVGTQSDEITENYSYNAQTGLLESQTVTKTAAPSTYLLNLSYDYAGANGKRTGQLTKIYNNLDRANKDRGFEYDALGRLIRATGGQGTDNIWAQRYEYDRYGNRSNVYSFGLDDYVRHFYQGAIGAAPAESWVQSQLATLRSAYAQGQSQFLTAMQNLGETVFSLPAYTNLYHNNHEYVQDLYRAYLYREPDSGGWASWETALNNGASRAEVRNGFAWAPEFYTKVAGISPYAPAVAVPRDGAQGIGYDQATNRVANEGWWYDAAGNQTRTWSNGVWQKYQYDAANRLVKVKNDSDVTIANYTYGDSNERLIGEEFPQGTSERTYYVGEGGTTIAEYTENGAATNPVWSRSYVYLGNRLLSTLTPNGGGEAVEYHHPDRLGTRIITNPATGSWSEQVTLPFGTALGAESSGNPSKRRFTSYDRSDATKLDYAVNRHYDSQQGRFTQVDPAGMDATNLANPHSLNLYAYCGDDPINHADPDGLGLIKALKRLFKKLFHAFVHAAIQAAISYVTTGNIHTAIHTGISTFLSDIGQRNGYWQTLRTPPTFPTAGITLSQIFQGTILEQFFPGPEAYWRFIVPINGFSDLTGANALTRLSPCVQRLLTGFFLKAGILFPRPLDLSNVRLHVGVPDWAQKLAVINIGAITIGNDIYISPDEVRRWAGRSWEDLELIAHELAHVEQYSIATGATGHRRLGQLAFGAAYLGGYLGQKLRGKSDKDAEKENLLERAAESKAKKIIETLKARGAKPCP